MQYRKLGRTALDVSAIGLGTEFLLDQPRETVVAVTQQAIAQGVNYFDLFWPYPTFRDNMGAAFQGYREQILLTAHVGCIAQDDQYCLTRDPGDSETFFLDYLRRCDTDYVDVLFLHNCNTQEDYNQMMRSDGLLGLARRLQHEDMARFLGFSGHNATIALQAVRSGQIDVLMFPINLASHAVPGKKDLEYACATHEVGLVAMKPYAGGRLLRKEHIIHVEDFQMGRTEMMGAPTSFEKPVTITPLQCLSYVLSQVGVSTTVPGCKNLGELAAALAYWQAADEEKDPAAVLPAFEDLVTGECVYCNHCLPCPSAIDIGKTLSLLDEAQQHLTAELQSAYDALSVKASCCVQCGDCVTRCPFGVDAMAKMDQAAELFES
jgi:predicted aldo/keto reductase-like oxidoreductase